MTRVFKVIQAGFHKPGTSIYRIFSGVVWTLIVISVMLLISISVTPEGHVALPWLQIIDRILLTIFALELVLRVITFVPPELRVYRWPPLGRLRAHIMGRLRYLLSPMTLVDLVTVAALVPALRGLRVLRLLRLLRGIKFFRYNNPFTGLAHALERDRLLFLFALAFLTLEVLLGGTSLFLIEKDYNPALDSLGDGLWWALVTLTTVGFGDITPVTALGRVVAGGLMVGGMFTLAMFAGIVGHSLLNAVLGIREEQFRMSGYVNHIVVCGYEDGMVVLLESLMKEHDIEQTRIVVFADMERPEDMPAELYFVRGDPTKESELEKVRMDRALAVVVAGPRKTAPQQADAQTILTLFTIRAYLDRRRTTSRRHRPLYVVAEILDSENVEHARTAGADEVIETRRLGFSLLAHAVVYHGSADAVSNVVLNTSSSVFVGRIPDGVEARTYGELRQALDLRSRDGMILGIRYGEHGEEQVNPPESLPILKNTHVLYIASERLLDEG